MRWSQLFAPTLRQDPADADAASHRLLLRAGFVRRLAAGHHALLPPAVRVRSKIIEVIREEMTRIGGQELALPAMHPAELWRRSGRWETTGEETFRLADRRGAELALGATHEEVAARLADELGSYRRLPQIWYQFRTAFRDEPRPRGGLIRPREFTLHDSYSLDVDFAGLDRTFAVHDLAYLRIFDRLGVPVVAVEAVDGAIGEDEATAFLCPTPAGEDRMVRCPSCEYAADPAKATSRLDPVPDGPGLPAPERFDTPHVRTIDELAVRHGVPAERQIKTLVYVLDDRLTLVLTRGDHALAERKLGIASGARTIRPARPEEIVAALGANPGSLGAVASTLPSGEPLPVLADEALRGRRDMTTGANVDGVHVRGVDVERDIAVTRWADLREVTAGEPCPRCGAALEVRAAIEVGRLVRVGRRVTEALGVKVLRADGGQTVPVMGAYRIGIDQTMAAIVETHHDDAGIVWPAEVAPFRFAVVLLDPRDERVRRVAERLHEALGPESILDDRDERPGAKFTDAELVGIPYRVTVGKRGVNAGTVEIKDRATGETATVPIEEAADRLAALRP
ncbi:proline--tRNA ligase [Thermomonospora catenispora]|uniref:proline--tRNA ligase n=1 Tax=Thermomonospora catenispora TaxID=2493090 RepID=UPI00111EB71E|nr:proline--tRNA ligase [Thermomonospora catenispora]TNY38408.1 proline--tRNA ligase [Thermomonospora catenispora]